jgi:uncharacterized protein with gpF-like domain
MKQVNSIINAVNETKADLVKPKRKYTKRKVNAVAKPEVSHLGKYARELEVKLEEKSRSLNAIEHSLIEKEKEVWNLECEVFDKKAVIKYLEEKLFQKGVRV